MSERVARRYDDTVDKKRVKSCVLKHLFWREFSNQKNRPNLPEILSPTRVERQFFKNFATDAAETKFVTNSNCEVSDNKSFVKSNLLRYSTISISKQFIRSNVQQGDYFPLLCIKTPFFWGSSATKKSAKKTRKGSLQRATNVTFSKFRGWRRKVSRKIVKTCNLSREILACDFLSFLQCDPGECDFSRSGAESLLTGKHQVKMTANKWRVPSALNISQFVRYAQIPEFPRIHSRSRSYLKYLDLQITTELLIDLLSAGDSAYSCENLFEILGTPVITLLIFTGTPVKTCWKMLSVVIILSVISSVRSYRNRKSCVNVRIWRKRAAVRRKSHCISERVSGWISRAEQTKRCGRGSWRTFNTIFSTKQDQKE